MKQVFSKPKSKLNNEIKLKQRNLRNKTVQDGVKKAFRPLQETINSD